MSTVMLGHIGEGRSDLGNCFRMEKFTVVLNEAIEISAGKKTQNRDQSDDPLNLPKLQTVRPVERKAEWSLVVKHHHDVETRKAIEAFRAGEIVNHAAEGIILMLKGLLHTRLISVTRTLKDTFSDK